MRSLQKQNREAASERRAKRQKLFNRSLLVGAIIIIVVVTAVALNRPTVVTLPRYLNRCIPLSGPWAYRSVFHLYIIVNGVQVTIPGGIGIVGTCVRPIYTFTSNGAVHVEPDLNVTFTMGDFFLVWGSASGPTWATFNQNQLFTYQSDSTHHISMYVNNATNTDYENFHLPTNSTTTPTSYFNVTITYG